MTEDFAAKQTKDSLEVVAVYADHPPKIKLGACLRVKGMINCICFFNEHARTSLILTFFLFIKNFGDLSPHGIHQL